MKKLILGLLLISSTNVFAVGPLEASKEDLTVLNGVGVSTALNNSIPGLVSADLVNLTTTSGEFTAIESNLESPLIPAL